MFPSLPFPARAKASTAVLSFVAVLALSACAAGAAAPQHRPGDLLSHSTVQTAAALPSAASTQVITYLSENAAGEPIVVSGTVSVPDTPVDDGGYPVISWAHGTSGYADICAPSGDTHDGPDHDYFGGITEYLDGWVKQGYAVVQTDYEGLGTPGGHPYGNGVSEANTVVDIVTAARRLDDRIGSDWVVMGHSQGGQAALFTAQHGSERAADLHLKGAVAIAPGGKAITEIIESFGSGGAGSPGWGPFLPVLMLGAQTVDPSIVPEKLLSDRAQPMLTTARTGCLAQLRENADVPADEIVRSGADLKPMVEYFAKQNPGAVTPTVPTMIVHGDADALVTPREADALVDELCARSPIDYRVYPGQDHRGAVTASYVDSREFVTAVMAGEQTADTCR